MIRALTAGDAALCAEIHAAASPGAAWTEADIAKLLGQPARRGWACEAGFILTQVAGGEAEILMIAVKPASQSQGIGRQLLDAALTAAQAAGGDRMFLEVAADNAPALALYRRTGFLETGRRNGYYRRMAGPAVDALVMARSIG